MTYGIILREDEEQVAVGGSVFKDDEEKGTIYGDTLIISALFCQKKSSISAKLNTFYIY
jgi:hypothetical protein